MGKQSEGEDECDSVLKYKSIFIDEENDQIKYGKTPKEVYDLFPAFRCLEENLLTSDIFFNENIDKKELDILIKKMCFYLDIKKDIKSQSDILSLAESLNINSPKNLDINHLYWRCKIEQSRIKNNNK